MEHVPGKPIGLQNSNDNICFTNNVFQLLNTIPEFRQKVRFTVPWNGCVIALKQLFANIRNSHIPLKTSTYLRSMEIPGYISGRKSYSHEFLFTYQPVDNAFQLEAVARMKYTKLNTQRFYSYMSKIADALKVFNVC